MNRDIKFRGKRIEDNEWIYGYLADEDYINNSNEIAIPSEEVDADTVGQFTGLLDCNRKEIYEGDILGFYEAPDFLPETVIFSEGCFMVKDDYTTTAMSAIDTECRTIIGNIHDNPEFLEGGAK